MWKPASVVPEHRKRATVVWGALLLGIVGYTAWQMVTLYGKYSNPSTNFSVSDDLYEFPTVDVCVWGGKGCDEEMYSSSCARSAGFTVYDPCFNETEDAEIPSQWANCVAFDLTGVDMQGFRDGCAVSKKPATTITMTWVTSLDPEEEGAHRESVGIFVGNETTPEYVTVPYTRLLVTPGIDPGEVTYIETAMTIGKSTRNYIGGGSVTSYPILSYSTGDRVDPTPETLGIVNDGDSSSYALGYLHLSLTQGGYSLTELTDVDPLDLATLLGNIGGFWEIMLVIWGLCFIASRSEAPTQKGRDFAQPIQAGKEIVTRKRRRSSASAATLAAEGFGEEQPYWNTAGRNQQKEATAGSFRVIPPVGARPPKNVAASFFRNPVQQDFPRPSLSTSSGRPVTSETSVITAYRGPTSEHNQPPSYADCA